MCSTAANRNQGFLGEKTVTAQDTAQAMGSGELAVYAAPAMIALIAE